MSVTTRSSGTTAITNSLFKGDKVSFQTVREGKAGKSTTTYSGNLSGDTIKGTVEIDARGKNLEGYLVRLPGLQKAVRFRAACCSRSLRFGAGFWGSGSVSRRRLHLGQRLRLAWPTNPTRLTSPSSKNAWQFVQW